MKLSKIANNGRSVMETPLESRLSSFSPESKDFFFLFLVNLNFLESICWVSHFQHVQGYNWHLESLARVVHDLHTP